MPELIDESMIDQLEEDLGAESVPEILDTFHAELAAKSAYFATCSPSEQLSEMEDMSHQLKSSAGYCGAGPLQTSATALNDALRAPEPDVERIARELERVRALAPATCEALLSVRQRRFGGGA